MLKGKHIILGITGGIAAYKSAVLARLLVKAGAEVQVIMTPSAREFITPLTMSTLTGKPVITEFFTANTGQWNSHVDLGLWADAMVIAPATACTIGKMAHGVADNMLVTTYLSAKSKVFVAPAMDLDMMAHPSTTANLELLRSYGNIIIEPECGELASHLVGKGRMAEPEAIVAVLSGYFSQKCDLAGKRVLVTAGPTHERIDPVRFIGNYSSGKMGFAIAEECAFRGADVTLVAGPVSLSTPSGNIKRINVTSAREMYEAVTANYKDADLVILAAAVADYGPETVSEIKLKREGATTMQLNLVRNPDIAATLGERKEQQILVGFALETDHELDNARHKLEKKNLDWIVLNSLRDPDAGFMKDTNKVTMVRRDGKVFRFPAKTKREVAADIISTVTDVENA